MAYILKLNAQMYISQDISETHNCNNCINYVIERVITDLLISLRKLHRVGKKCEINAKFIRGHLQLLFTYIDITFLFIIQFIQTLLINVQRN